LTHFCCARSKAVKAENSSEFHARCYFRPGQIPRETFPDCQRALEALFVKFQPPSCHQAGGPSTQPHRRRGSAGSYRPRHFQPARDNMAGSPFRGGTAIVSCYRIGISTDEQFRRFAGAEGRRKIINIRAGIRRATTNFRLRSTTKQPGCLHRLPGLWTAGSVVVRP
jgi:hypothetical protein